MTSASRSAALFTQDTCRWQGSVDAGGGRRRSGDDADRLRLGALRAGADDERTQVINLCRSYKYLGHGYYCSLLAEARGRGLSRQMLDHLIAAARVILAPEEVVQADLVQRRRRRVAGDMAADADSGQICKTRHAL